VIIPNYGEGFSTFFKQKSVEAKEKEGEQNELKGKVVQVLIYSID